MISTRIPAKGAYATIAGESEEVVGEIDVTSRCKLAVSAFHVHDGRDFGTFKITKLQFHKTHGWREDGHIQVNQFQLAQIKEFLSIISSLDLSDVKKTRLSLDNLQVGALGTLPKFGPPSIWRACAARAAFHATPGSPKPSPKNLLASRIGAVHAGRPGATMFDFFEFFAGGGMVRAGLGDNWHCRFANDFDPKKSAVYRRNWGDGILKTADVRTLTIKDMPADVDLAWASFPCQDLSLAGVGAG